MFETLQIIQAFSRRGIISRVEGQFVTVIWDNGDIRCYSAYQLRKTSARVVS